MAAIRQIFNRIIPRTWLILSLTVIHNPTRLRENHSRTFRVILFTDRQTNKDRRRRLHYHIIKLLFRLAGRKMSKTVTCTTIAKFSRGPIEQQRGWNCSVFHRRGYAWLTAHLAAVSTSNRPLYGWRMLWLRAFSLRHRHELSSCAHVRYGRSLQSGSLQRIKRHFSVLSITTLGIL